MAREYAFTPKKDSEYHKELIEQAETFAERVEIMNPASNWVQLTLAIKDKELIRSFCHENIMNILWYKYKIVDEETYRERYNLITLILIVAIPFAIWGTTEFVNYRDWETGQQITSIVTVVLTFIFAIHKWLTAWIEKRNFISSFNQAKIDLSNVLFRIENEHRGFALDGSGQALTATFRTALSQGIQESKKILQEETKNYFEKLANPGFDLSGAIISSATSAKQVFSQLKAERFQVEEWKKESQEKEKKETAKKEEKEALIFNVRKAILTERAKYQAIQDQVIDLSADEADLLEAQMSAALGPTDRQKLAKKLANIQTQLNSYHTTSDSIMIELAVKEAELELLLN
ncbi:hypothetical protein SAMN04488029_0125 [Reichenbachiella faecimaris]|uniref:SMODS and SLOG-associating 2TM effector domain-containing protein n=1 Tax=Reichenbachiella faecimaris TaxID=692418 RepID=A0A1W2G5Z5_REIFA|nr:hypothetical protein [Reichenbachiella faecimaris]SMD31788.1 hypothetical protein SAMN04488029_0125 [Reichenbachiella faecimaris]